MESEIWSRLSRRDAVYYWWFVYCICSLETAKHHIVAVCRWQNECDCWNDLWNKRASLLTADCWLPTPICSLMKSWKLIGHFREDFWKMTHSYLTLIDSILFSSNIFVSSRFTLTLDTLTSVCIFSILISTRLITFWQGELVQQSRASLVGDHFLYSRDLNAWFRADIVGRN